MAKFFNIRKIISLSITITCILLFCKNFIFSNNKSTQKLREYSFNVYSQFGEDGIIEKIFSIVPIKNFCCLEVGASDGFTLSNTANLWTNKNWKAILIEGDIKKFESLKKNTNNYDCTIINKYIDNKNNSIDKLLENLNFKEHIDLLSIDIDGNDYYILEALQIKPTLIICEYNPTIPHFLDIHQTYSKSSWDFGSSISALNRLAKNKGYKLIALTDVNCFFIDIQYAHFLEDFETEINKIVIEDYLKYFVTSYNGEPIICSLNNKTIYPLKNIGYRKNLISKNNLIKINKILYNTREFPKDYIDKAIKELNPNTSKVIVELGTMRYPLNHDIDNEVCEYCGDGHSTFLWARTNAQVYSVDINPNSKTLLQDLSKQYPNLKVITKDGIDFLKNFKKKIDLLFLDAWDVVPGTDYAEKHLEAYNIAKDKLHSKSIILIDDTDILEGGKGRLLIPQATKDGYKIIFTGRQTMLMK